MEFKVKLGEIYGFLGLNERAKPRSPHVNRIIKPDHGKDVIMGHNIQKEPLKAKKHLNINARYSFHQCSIQYHDDLLTGQVSP